MNARLNQIDLDALGFIDHNITINVIKDDQIVEKKDLISSEADPQRQSAAKTRDVSPLLSRSWIRSLFWQIRGKGIYRCKCCEEQYRRHKKITK